jgi:hypothetical protein
MDPSAHRGSTSHTLPSSHDGSNNDQTQPRVRFAEGEPQASYKIYQPTPRRERPPPAASSAAQPAVYWDNKGGNDREIDRESDANLAGYTFYREGTPTPPDYEAPEKRLGHGGGLPAPGGETSTAGGGTIRSDGDWSLADNNDVSPARKKRVLWAIIAAVVLIVIALGVGLGVGLSQGKGAAADPVQAPSRFVKLSLFQLTGGVLTWSQFIASLSS